MERARRFLRGLPANILSIVTMLAILWLTLAPKPLGDEPPPMFPGADKIVHGIMFGGLAIMLMLDWQRKHCWKRVTSKRTLVDVVVSSVFGALIEFAQRGMGIGRSFESSDILADTIGAIVFGIAYFCFQGRWSLRPG